MTPIPNVVAIIIDSDRRSERVVDLINGLRAVGVRAILSEGVFEPCDHLAEIRTDKPQFKIETRIAEAHTRALCLGLSTRAEIVLLFEDDVRLEKRGVFREQVQYVANNFRRLTALGTFHRPLPEWGGNVEVVKSAGPFDRTKRLPTGAMTLWFSRPIIPSAIQAICPYAGIPLDRITDWYSEGWPNAATYIPKHQAFQIECEHSLLAEEKRKLM